jgi:hypothetical protein
MTYCTSLPNTELLRLLDKATMLYSKHNAPSVHGNALQAGLLF